MGCSRSDDESSIMQAALQGWESYPLGIRRCQAGVDNTRQYQDELEKRSGDLFVNDPSVTKLEVIENHPDLDDLHTFLLNTIDELRDILTTPTGRDGTRVFLITQINSWSRLKITADMFKMMCQFYTISPRFLDVVIAFGKKRVSSDEHFIGCYGRLNRGGKTLGSEQRRSFELSYNLRYYEPHGRDLEDPWSCRHTAIHHKYFPENHQSVWIIIQSPKVFRENLESQLGELRTRDSCKDEHPLLLHIRYLTSSGTNFRKYLNYITDRLASLEKKVIFVRKEDDDCDIDISTSQDLQIIRRKLASALSIIEGTINVTSIILEESEALQSIADIEPNLQQAFQRELRYISNDLKSHASTAKKLMGFADDIRELNHKFLGILGEKLLHENGLSLREIATSGSQDTRQMMEQSGKVYKDSRTTRIATIIAMFYLPANLVMSVFSTGLIEYHSNSSWIGVKAQMWIAVVTSAVLAFATYIGATYWDHREQRQSARVLA